MKPILLIIDGMDKTGKTTLINYINKKTNFSPLIIDRGPIGYKAYSELYNKKNTPSQYDALENQIIKTTHLCVYLFSSEKILKKRFEIHSETPVFRGIKKNLELFNKYFKSSSLNKIKINTSKKTVQKTAEIILEKWKQI